MGRVRETRRDSSVTSAIGLDPSCVKRLRRALLRWHRGVERNVPWRRTRDPYRILVAEYMSQQTPLERVRVYYERFLQRFPDVHALARARLEDVRRVWEGLGYYVRARHLHQAARRIVREHGGRIPDDPAHLQALPGCGSYTAAAIASLAFDRPVPVVDGNVRRVLCRLFAISDDPRRPSVERQFRTFVAELIALGHRRGNRTGAREINQALMDLGALVCRPRAPHCARCCWMFACRARQLSDPTAFPKARARPRRPHYEIAVGVIWRGRARSTDGEVLIAQRREGGLLGGLWEFPGGKREPGESLRRCCAREIWEEVGLRVCVGRKLMTIRHAYSHFRITLHVFECRPLGGSPRALGCQQVRWVRCQQLSQYPFPAANRRIIEALQRESLKA